MRDKDRNTFRDLRLVTPLTSSEKSKIERMIPKLDELIDEIGELDPLSGNLLITAKTLLWSKLHQHGHPCDGCVISNEVKRLGGH